MSKPFLAYWFLLISEALAFTSTSSLCPLFNSPVGELLLLESFLKFPESLHFLKPLTQGSFTLSILFRASRYRAFSLRSGLLFAARIMSLILCNFLISRLSSTSNFSRIACVGALMSFCSSPLNATMPYRPLGTRKYLLHILEVLFELYLQLL